MKILLFKKLRIHIKTQIFIFIYFIGAVSAWSQTIDKARELSNEGMYKEARQIGFDLLKKGYDPDVALMIGRTYAWQQNYDSARIVISGVLRKFPDYFEGYKAIIDVEFWSGNYSKAIEYCNKALEKYAVGTFYLKKGDILYATGRKAEAIGTLEIYLKKYPEDETTAKKIQRYKWELKKNEIRYLFMLDIFDKSFDRDPWQIHSIEYKRNTKPATFIVRANFAKRFNKTGYQFELDIYPKINSKNYLYLNYGNSSASVFPKHRAGLEWFHSFKGNFEGSAGLRLLLFEDSNIDFYTIMIGKYLKNNLISLRTFITPEKTLSSYTTILETRHFFTTSENYMGIKLGYGTSPDELRNLIDTPQRLSVKSQWIRVEFNQLLSYYWLFGFNFTLGQEERLPNQYAGYYSFETRLSFLF